MSNINEEIRTRVLAAIEEIKATQRLSYKEVMESLNDVQQVHTQLKNGKRYPTLEHIILLNSAHKYSFNWLLLGIAPKKTIKSKSPLDRLFELESDFKDLKKILTRK